MRLVRRSIMAGTVFTALLGAGSAAALAPQARTEGATPPERVATPFGAHEKSEYQVKLGALSVGSGSMEILGIQEVDGHDTYHARLRISGGIPFARVDDKFESWIDVDGLFSRRFKQDQKEITYERNRTYHFFPESLSWRRENGDTGTLPTDRPLDDVSFLYYVRTLPLKVGDTYTIPRYFKGDGNPVVIKVLRTETVKVPAGTFETVVVQPIIKTDGLFGEGGKAEVYFTNDSRRILVQMRSSVPIVGSLSLHLTKHTAG